MKGQTFKHQNDVLGAGKNENCYDLPIARVKTKRRDEDIKADQEANPGAVVAEFVPGVISFWQLEPGDLEGIVKNCGIYFYCVGNTHPPISLHAECPIDIAATGKRELTECDHINTDLQEGTLLRAAIAKLMEYERNKTGDELLAECKELADQMQDR